MLKRYLFTIEALVSVKAVFLLPHLYTLFAMGPLLFWARIVDSAFIFPTAYYALKGKKVALTGVAIYLLAMYTHDLYINVYAGSMPPFLKTYRVLLALYFFTGATLMLRDVFHKPTTA
ncbi:MAG: hypothetical protein AB7E32_13735 [Desulfovibrio sp.]